MPASKKLPKCAFCEHEGATISGYSKKLKPRMACKPCVDFISRAFAPFKQSVIPAINVDLLSETAQQNALFDDDGAFTLPDTEAIQTKQGLVRETQWTWRVTGHGPGYRARLRLQDNLESCACTHKAKRHIDDGQGNLLACRDCDCDHFFYAIPQVRNSDLIVLQAAQVSAEPTKADKLEAMAQDERTNANERLIAARRLAEMLEREAA